MRFRLKSAARLRAEADSIVRARATYRSIRDGSSDDWSAIWALVPQRHRSSRVYNPVNREIDRARHERVTG